jgi:hypothetical protein
VNIQCTHRFVKGAILLSLLVFIPASVYPRKNPKPVKHLPAEMLAAKSVYLDCQLFMQDTPYYVTQRLKQWGRFRIVENPGSADLVLTITSVVSPTALLCVTDRSYHKVLWSTATQGTTIPGRCVRLIDLLRQRIEVEEASLQKGQLPTPRPASPSVPSKDGNKDEFPVSPPIPQPAGTRATQQ